MIYHKKINKNSCRYIHQFPKWDPLHKMGFALCRHGRWGLGQSRISTPACPSPRLPSPPDLWMVEFQATKLPTGINRNTPPEN